MQHRGEIVKKAVKKSGVSVTKISEKIGKSRRWMYLAFENPDLSLDWIIEIGKVIYYDFSNDIKEFKRYSEKSNTSLAKEPLHTYQASNKEAEMWKNKYLRLLEMYNQLLISTTDKDKKSNKSRKNN